MAQLQVYDLEMHEYVRAALETLTPREQDVLTHLLEGRTNSEIARALRISPKTVDIHRSNLLAKLSVRNTVGLIIRVLSYRFGASLRSLEGRLKGEDTRVGGRP
jgi:DNA-binding NarL/FixJ family response regulator